MRNLLLAAAALGVLAFTAPAAIAAPADLTAPWTGPYGGVPPFDKVAVKDFPAALDAAMNEAKAEYRKIADNPEPATFANTILAMESAGKSLNRVGAVFGIWSGNLSTPEFQKIEAEYAPKLSAFSDEINHDPRLFARISAIHDGPEMAKLDPVQKRLVEVNYVHFVQNGAKLDDKAKARVTAINERLASLYAAFSQNELYDEGQQALIVTDRARLKGLSEAQISAASAEAERRGKKGAYAFANTRSAIEPLLTYDEDRALREEAFRLWTSRGDHPGAHDNNPVVAEILKLRAERSKLLGYPTYAHWHLADAMAKDPQKAMDLMMQVWTPAVAQVRRDVADMQTIIDAEHGGFKLQPWDYRFYAEKLRKKKYDLDMNAVKPYLALDNVREAMFMAAGKLYGFSFKKVEGLPVFEKHVTVYEVHDRTGALIGVWYFDPFAREGKNSGAWMNAYREQSTFEGPVITIVSNNANFIEGKPGEPVLLSWDDARTMFHEFGHALHGLNSKVAYPSLSGTNVDRDYVEFPSQFNENYFTTPEVLAMLKNAKGEPIPASLIARLKAASTFNQGFATVEALASAIVDMKMHLAGETPVEPHAFEKATLAEIGMPDEIVMRHRIPQFGHVFSGEGYAAGYYGYIWADVLEHDAFEAFEETGNPYDPATAKRFQDLILSVGNTVDPADAFRAFRGRDASADALLRFRGFAPPKKP